MPELNSKQTTSTETTTPSSNALEGTKVSASKQVETAREIIEANNNLKEANPEYYERTLKQRLKDGFGSRYGVTDTKELEKLLFNPDVLATAEEYTPEEGAMPGCKYYKVTHPDLSAKLGVVDLTALPPDTKVRFANPKNIGENAATVCVENYDDLPDVDYTTIVIGIKNGKEMVFTFFPGETFPMDQMMLKKGETLKEMTVKEALELGLRYAKTTNKEEFNNLPE